MAKYRYWIIGTLLFSAVAIITFLNLSETPYANGWDSYFYLIQAKSLAEEGAMHSPSASLIHPLVMMMGYFFGGDYVLGYKVLMSILSGGFVVLAAMILLQRTQSENKTLIGVVLVVLNPFVHFVAAQYPKNMLGMVLFLWFIYTLGNRRIWLPLLVLLINFFGHKLTFGMCCITLVVYYSDRLLNKKVILILMSAVVLMILITLLFPGLLALADVERFSNMLSAQPQWASMSFINSLGMDHVESVTWIMMIALDLVFLVALFFGVKRYRSVSSLTRALLVLGFLFLFPFLRWADDGLALRLYLSYALIIPLLLIAIPVEYKTAWIPTISIIAGLGLSIGVGYDPKLHDPPYHQYELIKNKLAQNPAYVESELVIGHKALAEYLTYETGKDVLPWQPEYEVKDELLWRIATDLTEGDLKFYLGVDKQYYFKLIPGYYFLKESDWQVVLARAAENNDNQFLEMVRTWRNPHLKRPGFLLRNKE